MEVIFDKLGFSNKIKPKKTENVSHDSASNKKNNNIVEEFEKGNLNIQLINRINDTIKFLIEMDSPKLIEELYQYMKGQIRIYDKYDIFKVLELTTEQVQIFKNKGIDIELFKEEPFNVDSVVVYENKELNYKYIDSELELNKFLLNYEDKVQEDKGLYFLTTYVRGYLGEGIYVCDEDTEESNYLFNNFINDRIYALSRNDNKYVHFLQGYYNGTVKRCIMGELKGAVILVEPIKHEPLLNKEELCLYGEIEKEILINPECEFNNRIREVLSDCSLRLSSIDSEILEDAQG